MIISHRKLVTLLASIIICCTSASLTPGQQTSATESRPLRVIKYDGDMARILNNMTEIFKLPIGIEVDPQQPRARVKLELQDPTLHDVLNAIVQSAPRYKWRESDGFIEVLPVAGSSPLLDTMISSFHVSDVDQTEAVEQLINLLEVQDSMRAMGLHRRTLGPASVGKKGEKFSMTLEGVTMRQALHKIFGASGKRFWIFQRSADSGGGEFFSISDQAR